MTSEELVGKWVDGLTEEQAKKALHVTVLRLIEADEIHILDDEKISGPYWESCGEPLLGE